MTIRVKRSLAGLLPTRGLFLASPCRTAAIRLAIRETILELQGRFGIARPGDLTITEASDPIDAFKQLDHVALVPEIGQSQPETYGELSE